MSTTVAVKGFSLINRWLLYTNMMLCPAQYLSGIRNNCPSNIGFLAYNWYTQIMWYKAARAKELGPVCLTLPHFNLVFSVSYLGGVTSGNMIIGTLLGLGTAGVIILNTVTSWVSWATNQQAGYGIYRFFFFGWRTLTPGWHKFFLCWEIFDSMFAFSMVLFAINLSITVPRAKDEEEMPWWIKYLAIPGGAAIIVLGGWPLILWTELVIGGNKVEWETDWVSVWLFVAQVATMLMPGCSAGLQRFGRRRAEPADIGLQRVG
ncbi:hypothetical protein ABW19_dt0201055 [Dactylella cylindrospora]|nr:hypothetical protein ABW19_dt0201055 [Dactylella cylindrospora]